MSIGSVVSAVIEVILDICSIFLFDILIPIGQSLVPGSPNSMWHENQYLTLVLCIIMLGMLIVANKLK